MLKILQFFLTFDVNSLIQLICIIILTWKSSQKYVSFGSNSVFWAINLFMKALLKEEVSQFLEFTYRE